MVDFGFDFNNIIIDIIIFVGIGNVFVEVLLRFWCKDGLN